MEAVEREQHAPQSEEERSIPEPPPGGPPHFDLGLNPCGPGEDARVDASPHATLAEIGTLVAQADDSDDSSPSI